MEQNKESRQQILTLPMAIVAAAVIIAGVILYMYHPATTAQPAVNGQAAPSATTAPDASALPPITAADHILGDPNAPIKIVEYSDPSCPYCKMFQSTMLEVMQDYGASGQVAWVYRQFPLDKPDANGDILHPNAGTQAIAFECAASIGGNAGFWAYQKDWFSTFPDNGADEAADADNQQIAATAKDTGLDASAFNDCLSSKEPATAVDRDYQGGLALGIDGTPTSYIVTTTGSPIAIQGAQSYSTIKETIDAILSQGQGATSTQ